MFKQRNHRLAVLLAVSLAGAALVASGCRPGPLAAQGSPASTRSITVSGRGSVSGKPDLALVSLGVETYAATVGEASQQNNAKMAAVMAKLKELGIADKDIQTSNFNISFDRQGPDPSNGQYRVSNMVQLKVRNPEQAGSLIDAMVKAGANQVWGVSFTIEDQAALEAQARAKAVEDARQRGDALAKLESVQLGQVLTINEGGAMGPAFAAGAAYGKGADTSISPGEVEVSYQVQVTFAIQ